MEKKTEIHYNKKIPVEKYNIIWRTFLNLSISSIFCIKAHRSLRKLNAQS